MVYESPEQIAANHAEMDRLYNNKELKSYVQKTGRKAGLTRYYIVVSDHKGHHLMTHYFDSKSEAECWMKYC